MYLALHPLTRVMGSHWRNLLLMRGSLLLLLWTRLLFRRWWRLLFRSWGRLLLWMWGRLYMRRAIRVWLGWRRKMQRITSYSFPFCEKTLRAKWKETCRDATSCESQIPTSDPLFYHTAILGLWDC